MRIEKVRRTFSPFVNIVISATADEVDGNTALDWHNEVQVVNGHDVEDLLDEAARRLNESDSGVDWSRAVTLKDLAAEIRGEKAVAELANRHADRAAQVWAEKLAKPKGAKA